MDKRLLQRVRIGGTAGKVIEPQLSVTSTPVTSAVIDRLDTSTGALARSMLIITSWAAATTGTVTLTNTLLEGATTSPATGVTLKTALPGHSCVAIGACIEEVNLEGMNRYIKVVTTPTAGSSGVVYFGVNVVLGDMDINPEATAATVYEKLA